MPLGAPLLLSVVVQLPCPLSFFGCVAPFLVELLSFLFGLSLLFWIAHSSTSIFKIAFAFMAHVES
jgi:hypothetical protein